MNIDARNTLPFTVLAPHTINDYNYFPVLTELPVPPACCSVGPLEAWPCPELAEMPPFEALEMATPVADTPPGPALPVPKPAPEPVARELKTAI